MVEIRPSRLSDANALAGRLRAADRAEIAAGSGGDPLEDLRYGIAVSAQSWTAWIGDEVFAIFGVCAVGLEEGVGAPWMLGSDLIDKHPRSLILHAADYIARMRVQFPILRNAVHAENIKAVRWLRRAGFSISQPVWLGHGWFHPFEMR